MKMNRFKLCLTILWLVSLPVFAGITHGPYLQAVGENEATIVWTTETPCVSWVEVAPAGDESFYAVERPQFYQTRDGNRVIGKLHKITLTGLAKGTEYRYRIFSKEVLKYHGQHNVLYGNVFSSKVYNRNPLRFTTLDREKKNISFVMLNDIHGRVDDLKALCNRVRYGKTDLMIFNGDMVDHMVDETNFFAGFMDESVNMFAGEVPVFYARGNHETRGAFNMSFSDYFPSHTGKLYYSFRQGPVHFIVLDSGEDKPDSDIEYSGLAQFDAYRSEQCEWLKKDLQSESFRTALYRVVIVHIPPFGDWHGTIEVREKFLPMLNQAGITAMLCGHLHRYIYLEPDRLTYDYPILINAHNTSLEIHADADKMTVKRYDTSGKELHSYIYPKENR
ncbi:MAG: metallophosphoesterase family protein [Bacteroidales bacterium]|jgi:3',5'-cyclic AMP phosphodiesterase CpdA|nr:metallophosphoesterase family protein [Bacteroidales bacterium]